MKKINLIIVVLFLSILTGCTREVTDEEIVVFFQDKEVMGSYTGVLTDGAATGEGTFVVAKENGNWTYTGNFENNEIKGNGILSNYEYETCISNETINVLYNGKSIDGIPNGEGKIEGSLKQKTFMYDGEINNGDVSGKGIISNYPYEMSYENIKMNGIYSGDVLNGVPDGKGKFSFNGDEIKFEYEGTWKEGKLSGEGQLITDHYTIEFADVVRTGKYEGSVKDGRAFGEGVYTAVNDDGNEYVYTGMFENGTFNGYGERIFTDKSLNFAETKGTYTNGEFTPTKSELLAYIGGVPDFINYYVAEESLKFIDEHENLFMAEDKKMLNDFHKNEITMNELYKKPTEYLDTIVSVSKCKVIQIREEEFSNHTITWFICNDSNNNNVFVLADSELPKVNKNSRVRVYGLPIGLASYKNGFGAETTAYVIFASFVE